MENNSIEEWIEGEVVRDLAKGKIVENWLEENLKKFEEVGKRLIIEALYWHDSTANSIRTVYTGNSRTTLWKKKRKKN